MANGHVRRNVGHRGINHAGINCRQLFRIVAAVGHLRAQLRITEISEIDLVELEIAATCIGEGVYGLAVSLAQIAIEIVQIRVDRLRHGVAAVAGATTATGSSSSA